MSHPASRLCGLTSPYLHAVVAKGDLRTLTYLIEAGAALEARDSEGRTALHVALDHHQDACYALLVRAGAEWHARDARGRSVASRIFARLGRTPTPPTSPTAELRHECKGATVVISNLWKRKQKQRGPEANVSPSQATPAAWPTSRQLEWADVEALGGFQEDALDLQDALDARDREVRRG